MQLIASPIPTELTVFTVKVFCTYQERFPIIDTFLFNSGPILNGYLYVSQNKTQGICTKCHRQKRSIRTSFHKAQCSYVVGPDWTS
jgi:hypothetical protein